MPHTWIVTRHHDILDNESTHKALLPFLPQAMWVFKIASPFGPQQEKLDYFNRVTNPFNV